MKQWSTLRKLLLLRLIMGGGVPIETLTATGTSPLSLANAIAHRILSLTQTGKCSQASTPTPTSPVDIKCNNGALKMLNLANMTEDNIVVGKYINNSGAEQGAPSNFYYSPYIPVKASTAYTLKTSRSLSYSNFMEYDASKGFIKRTLYGSSGTPAGDTTTHTTGATTAYIRFGSNINGANLTAADVLAINWMLTEGSTAMDYVPYGQISTIGTPEVITVTHADSTTETAGAENLFAIDSTRADTQDIISGLVTHKIGIKVFDGTEDWSRTSARAQVTLENSAGGSSLWTPICSHYNTYGASTTLADMDDGSMKYNGSGTATLWKDSTHNTSLDDWKAWVKSQYDAGTPIILIYPLAEPTTETVTGQPLSTTAGTNTVSWTAEVSGKTMSAEYKGSTAYSNKVGTGKVGYMKI